MGRAGALLGAVVRAESDVVSARRDGRTDEAVLTDADENDVLQMQWEGGILELVRVGDLEGSFGIAVRSAADELSVPQFRALKSPVRGGAGALPLESVQHIAVDPAGFRDAARGVGSGSTPTRGLSELATDALSGTAIDQVTSRVAEYVLPPIISRIEAQRMPQPGLYFLNPDGSLADLVAGKDLDEGPHLVLAHGTFSNTESAFKHLFTSPEWGQLYKRYGDKRRVLALEQRTVSEGPARNAIQLIDALSKRTRVHLLTHSRGGLVGELFCREPWTPAELERTFLGDAFASVRQDLIELGAKQFRNGGPHVVVERFLRVAAPAAGTQLAGRRLDQFLSVGLTLLGKLVDAGTGWFDFAKSIAVQIVAARTRADACPGLEAMMPDSPFIRFLNVTKSGTPPESAEKALGPEDQVRAREIEDAEQKKLAVVSGDVQGGRWFQLVKEVFADFYFRKRANDFVVDTASMKRGVPRKAAFHYHWRGAEADHFSYFQDKAIRERALSYLGDGRTEGFDTLDRGTEAIPSRLWFGDTKSKAPKRPHLPTVFLVPGIMGTRLAAPDGDLIWVSLWELAQGGLKKLMLPDESPVKVLGPIELAYRRLTRYLERDFNVEPFGFDWRQSIKASSALLVKEIESVLDEQPNAKVHIVAHSMGGLVSRGLIAWHRDVWQRLVDRGGRLLMLGTPNFGSFVPAQVMLGQSTMLNRLAFVDQSSNQAELTEIIKAFPGLLEMLPRRKFEDIDVDFLDENRWQPFGKAAPDAGLLEAARAVRDELDEAKGYEQSMIYVAGSGRTPVALEQTSRGPVFLSNSRGDETVPWALGKLERVPTYYVDATHGNLPDYPDAFPGYVELLKDGRTTKLAPEARSRETAVPTRDSSGRAARLDRVDPAPEPVLYFPTEHDLLAGFLASAEAAEEQTEQRLELWVVNGHIHASRYPIVVGHYEGDPITSVEAVLDRWLGGQLSRDHALRIYPGPVGTMRWYRHPSGGERGVIVVGLGQAASLTRARLTETLGEGLLRYAADRYELAPLGTPLELTLTSLLIGSWGKLTVEDSVCAVVAAVRECNQRLKTDPSRFVKYVAVQFMELYRDLATLAAHALLRLQETNEASFRVRPSVKTLDTFRRSRPASHSGYYDRVSVRSEESVEPTQPAYYPPPGDPPGQPPSVPSPPPPGPPRPDFINYEVVTGLARTDLRKRCVQWSHIDKLLQLAPEGDKGAVDTLFQYLLPFELKNAARDAADLVLQLDTWTAQIPWELMAPDEGESDEIVRRGILRTLQIDRPRLPQPTKAGRVLVIGEPKGVHPPLPGARAEAEEVTELFTRAGLFPRPVLGAGADENFRALLEDRYDIIHIAAHGHFDAKVPKHSGVVLADGRFLTACEFENLKATPSVVFLNCCHLGRIRLRQPGAWGASVAEELIRIGVGVVVVAGWAVSDQAAVVFAKTLYGSLLQGDTLMSAVRLARQKTREATTGADVTWGAYQVYGDPGFVLPIRAVNTPAGGRRGGGKRNFVSPHELAEHILDLEVRAGEERESAGGALEQEVDELWNETFVEWRERGDVSAAFGKLYGALGSFEKAIDRYSQASASSDAATSSMEQLANYKARRAVLLLESLPTDPAQAQAARTLASKLLHESLEELNALLKLGSVGVAPSASRELSGQERQASSERYALLGATLRRIARCQPYLGDAELPPLSGREGKKDYLEAALDAYRKAAEAKSARKYYPLLLVQASLLCVEPSQVTAAALSDVREAAKAASDDGDAFAEVVLVEVDLLEAVARSGDDAWPPDTARQLARRLLDALEASGASAERSDSLRANWQTLALLARDPVVKRRLLELVLELGVGVPQPPAVPS